MLVQMIRTNTGQCQMENLRTNDLKLLQGEGIVWCCSMVDSNAVDSRVLVLFIASQVSSKHAQLAEGVSVTDL